MTHALAFDLETVPQQRHLDAPYPASEREPPSNYKSDDAIAKWREKDRQQWEASRLKSLALSPLTGRIVCAATATFDAATGAPVRDHRTAPTEDGEAAVIAWLWHALAQTPVVVTFNGMGFDVPYLLLRSAILGVTPTLSTRALSKRYTYDPHYDVRMALCNWDSSRKGTLDDACAAFGLPGKSGSGADVWPLVQAGRWADLAAYAMDDAERTLAIYERLSRVIG